jgi:hypothetical protein
MLVASPGTSRGQLLVDSDFNASADSAALRSSAGGGWYESRSDRAPNGPNLLTLDTSAVAGNSSKKAKLTASGTYNAYLTQAFSPAQTGTFYAQWDIYVDSIMNLNHTPADPDRGGWMLIGDATDPTRTGPNSDDPERFVYMAFLKDGGGTTGTMDLVARDRDDTWSNFTTVAPALSLDQWYTIKVHCNLAAGIYDVYVNGVFQQTVTSRNAKTQVSHISFATWDDGAGTFYVDNVTATFCPGDINASGARDGSDLARIIKAFGSVQGQPHYDPFADLNGSNGVDLADLTAFAGTFGQSCP